MAKIKRYELYEGDDELISSTGKNQQDVPSSPAETGTSTAARPQESRRRYFARNEMDDGLGAPPTLYDDFERFRAAPEPSRRIRPVEPKKNRAPWIVMITVCLVILITLGGLMLPQLTGIRYRFLPNVAFANGTVITLDEQQEDMISQCRSILYTDRIYNGIYIDGCHVGGMTKEEAIRTVEAVHEKIDTTFDIVVSIGNEAWHVNSERVPFSRNIEETVNRAWACGRGNTESLRGSGLTPFQERANQASAILSSPISFTTEQDYDHQALRTMVEGIANYVNREPVSSTVESFDFNTQTFTFTEDRPGARVDTDALYARLTQLLDNGVTTSTVRVEPEKILAEVTRTELMNRFGLISAYTTSTTNNKNRNTNIQLSANAISGKTVLPGETFSFNKTTGERTTAKGYKEAPAISGGQSKDEVGGGVCQTSSTLFNAVVRADLEIVERNPHAWPSSYIEKGFDATVNWPGLDFQFRNNTEWPIFIIAGYANRKVTVNIYGMSLGPNVRIDLESEVTRTFPKPTEVNYVLNTNLAPGESKKTVSARSGYEVQTWKIWYQGNREVRRELLFTTTYKAYQETVEYNPR